MEEAHEPPLEQTEGQGGSAVGAELRMAIHCNVFTKVTRHFTFQEPRHWIVLNGQVIWDFPGPFLRPGLDPGRTPRVKPEPRGDWLDYWESGYGMDGLQPSTPSFLMETWIDRPRGQLMTPIEEDRWELTDLLRAADRRLGRAALTCCAKTLDKGHPVLHVLEARWSGLNECRLNSGVAESELH